MKQYIDILRKIKETGEDREGRNGDTRALWCEQARFNLEDGFPAVTTKKLAFKAVLSELLWFIQGPTKNGRMDNNELKKLVGKDETVWTANAESDYWKPKAQFEGDLGRVYGAQWRDWKGPAGESVDQLANAIENIKTDPYDRRIIVSAFNPGEIDQMALPPCHLYYHFFVVKGKLSMHMVQRSCDMFLGVPFNIASYAILLKMVAQVTNLEAHELVITFEDAHIYHNHYDAVDKQLARTPGELPLLWINPNITNIDSFTMDDFKLVNYKPQESIKAKMAV
ncbi:MAG: thymidylate synthase [Candidatus Paceibacteria bacterium]|jgi:thymidylate synthase